MKIFKLENTYYCIAGRGFSYEKLKKKVTSKLKMRKNSFSQMYSLKILKDLFEYTQDLKQEYLDFYSEEYEDFLIYLYQKELIDEDAIQSFGLQDDQTLLKLRMDMSNYNASSLIGYDDDNNLEILNEVLKGVNI